MSDGEEYDPEPQENGQTPHINPATTTGGLHAYGPHQHSAFNDMTWSANIDPRQVEEIRQEHRDQPDGWCLIIPLGATDMDVARRRLSEAYPNEPIGITTAELDADLANTPFPPKLLIHIFFGPDKIVQATLRDRHLACADAAMTFIPIDAARGPLLGILRGLRNLRPDQEKVSVANTVVEGIKKNTNAMNLLLLIIESNNEYAPGTATQIAESFLASISAKILEMAIPGQPTNTMPLITEHEHAIYADYTILSATTAQCNDLASLITTECRISKPRFGTGRWRIKKERGNGFLWCTYW